MAQGQCAAVRLRPNPKIQCFYEDLDPWCTQWPRANVQPSGCDPIQKSDVFTKTSIHGVPNGPRPMCSRQAATQSKNPMFLRRLRSMVYPMAQGQCAAVRLRPNPKIECFHKDLDPWCTPWPTANVQPSDCDPIQKFNVFTKTAIHGIHPSLKKKKSGQWGQEP